MEHFFLKHIFAGINSATSLSMCCYGNASAYGVLTMPQKQMTPTYLYVWNFERHWYLHYIALVGPSQIDATKPTLHLFIFSEPCKYYSAESMPNLLSSTDNCNYQELSSNPFCMCFLCLSSNATSAGYVRDRVCFFYLSCLSDTT